MTNKVSVILTSYNKPRTVAKAIESVLNQTYQDWELFIMDDNSNTETVEIINKYANDPRIFYFNSKIEHRDRYKTTRYATLINEGISKSTGKYLTYLTDDNIYLPERFEIMVNVLNRYSNIEIVYSQQIVEWLDEKGVVKRKGIRKAQRLLTNPVGVVDHCSVMHTRRIADAVFKEYGSFWDDDPAYWNYGDAVFWRRLTKFKPFYPIQKSLDIALKTPQSFQRLYTHLPKKIPNGILVKGLSADIYLIDNQKRRKISPKVFEQLKYDHHQIVSIPDPFLFKYEEGIPVDQEIFEDLTLFPNQRLIKSSQDSNIYYIQNNKKHLIRSLKALNDYKFHQEQVIEIADEVIATLPQGSPMEEISQNISILPDGVLFRNQSTFYISLDNYLHPIEKKVAVKLNLPVSNPVVLNHSLLQKFKQGEPFVWG